MPIGFYDFYKALAFLNSNINCSHSFVLPNNNFESYLNESIKAVPFYFIALDGRLYVLFNGTLNENIKPGDELLAINDRKVSSITFEVKLPSNLSNH